MPTDSIDGSAVSCREVAENAATARRIPSGQGSGSGSPEPEGRCTCKDDCTSRTDSRRDYEQRQLTALMGIAGIINSRLDLGHILSSISKELYRIIDYDIGCVAIYEKDENFLVIRHITRRNGDNSGEGTYVPLDESNLIGWVAINKEPILRRNIPEDKRFSEIMEQDNLKSDIVVPLMAKGSLIGTVNIGSYECNHFSEFELDLVVNFSKLISVAIENSQLLNKLKYLGEKYRLLMKNATDLIVFVKPTGEISECNQATYGLFGYGPGEVIGRQFFYYATPDRREEARESFFKVLRGENIPSLEHPYLKKNGEIVYLEINAKVIKMKGHPYLMAVAHDVTERKKLQEKITIQNRELRAVNSRLRELDEMKRRFLDRTSHELRTPLSVIMAYTGTLLEDRENEIDNGTQLDFLRIIESQSSRLLDLINELLDLSKIEISESMLDIRKRDFNEIVLSAVEVVGPVAKQKDVEMEVSLDPAIGAAPFDELRIKQACLNLLHNAIKLSGEGGSVSVTSLQSSQEVILAVNDSGPFIEREYLSCIFDGLPKIKVKGAEAEMHPGMGLQLVKHYIEIHRGRVWVESRAGEGSTFYFSLPKVADEEAPQAASDAGQVD